MIKVGSVRTWIFLRAITATLFFLLLVISAGKAGAESLGIRLLPLTETLRMPTGGIVTTVPAVGDTAHFYFDEIRLEGIFTAYAPLDAQPPDSEEPVGVYFKAPHIARARAELSTIFRSLEADTGSVQCLTSAPMGHV